MKICIANFYYNLSASDLTPDEFLDRMPLLHHQPASLAGAGHQVDVVQLFPKEASFTIEHVNYHFVRPVLLEKAWARVAARMSGQVWTRHVAAVRAARRVLGLQPDVVHFHGLTLNASLFLLQLLRRKDGPVIVSQYHGGQLASGRLERKVQSRGLSQVQRALFGRTSFIDQFVNDGLLERQQVVEVMDKSTTAMMRSRPAARQESGIQGSPVFLWYAALEPNRDPMTAIQGFEHILRKWPKAQLYVYFGRDALLTQLRAYVIAHPALARHVHFRGRPPNGSRETIFNSADFLLQTDRLANNSHAVLEAMACGVIPVVSDIPSFRTLVDNGRCGFLFPPGDAEALAEQLLTFSPGKIAGRAALVHDWFEVAYSYDAVAGVLVDIYAEAIGERRSRIEEMGQPVAEASGR